MISLNNRNNMRSRLQMNSENIYDLLSLDDEITTNKLSLVYELAFIADQIQRFGLSCSSSGIYMIFLCKCVQNDKI